jgi:heme/copper-type cytochrome/quinol oxidase subunit 2
MDCIFFAFSVCHAQSGPVVGPRLIELTADHDSRYRSGGKVAPTIEARAGEPLILRITASRAKEVARDGSVHGLVLLNKNLDAVPGWRFYLHPGVQELAVKAPEQPGSYTAVCIVICSDMHDGMKFTLIVAGKSKAKE